MTLLRSSGLTEITSGAGNQAPPGFEARGRISPMTPGNRARGRHGVVRSGMARLGPVGHGPVWQARARELGAGSNPRPAVCR